jgi:hypothetical protein
MPVCPSFVPSREQVMRQTPHRLTAPDEKHPRRRRFEFDDVLIDVIALCAFECAQIIARLGRLDASKLHFRAALRAGRFHNEIAK